MPSPGELSNGAVFFTADSAEKNFGTTRHLLKRDVEPDAYLQSGYGKRYPVWLKTSIEAYIAGGAR